MFATPVFLKLLTAPSLEITLLRSRHKVPLPRAFWFCRSALDYAALQPSNLHTAFKCCPLTAYSRTCREAVAVTAMLVRNSFIFVQSFRKVTTTDVHNEERKIAPGHHLERVVLQSTMRFTVINPFSCAWVWLPRKKFPFFCPTWRKLPPLLTASLCTVAFMHLMSWLGHSLHPSSWRSRFGACESSAEFGQNV